MKKFITSSVLITLLAFSFASCKKNDGEPTQTTLQKIQGAWVVQNVAYNSHYSGADHTSSQGGTANDIFDFRTDGKVYSSFSGYKDTTTYSLIGDTQILIDGIDKYDIKTLTSSSFIIYNKDAFSNGDYDETTIAFKK